MSKPIFIVNGPNLNFLGKREPDIYGPETLSDIRDAVETVGQQLGVGIEFRQSNHEGELIDWLQEAYDAAAALIINAGGYSHTSVSLRDAVAVLRIPVIEVHLSNIYAREEFRRKSYLTDVVHGTIAGFGARGYTLAVEAAVSLMKTASARGEVQPIRLVTT